MATKTRSKKKKGKLVRHITPELLKEIGCCADGIQGYEERFGSDPVPVKEVVLTMQYEGHTNKASFVSAMLEDEGYRLPRSLDGLFQVSGVRFTGAVHFCASWFERGRHYTDYAISFREIWGQLSFECDIPNWAAKYAYDWMAKYGPDDDQYK